MGAGTWESHHAITTLLYRYAECIDAADFDGIGALFADGKITNEGYRGDDRRPRRGRATSTAGTNRVHADGTLRTRHLATNVIVDIDESAGTATARSAFVVFQATPDACPLQPIVAGRYHDAFARGEHGWHFTHRHILFEQVGDVHEHLTLDLAAKCPRRPDRAPDRQSPTARPTPRCACGRSGPRWAWLPARSATRSTSRASCPCANASSRAMRIAQINGCAICRHVAQDRPARPRS